MITRVRPARGARALAPVLCQNAVAACHHDCQEAKLAAAVAADGWHF